MKLSQINEAQYAAPKIKKSMENLLRFFEKEDLGDEIIFHAQENFVVRDNNARSRDNEVSHIEFSYENTENSDHVLVTYMDNEQSDIKKTEIIENFIIFETRQVY